MFYKLSVERWVLDIFLFLYVPSTELSGLPYVIYKSRTVGKDFIMTEGKTSAVF